MSTGKITPQFPNRTVFVKKWSLWVSWRMVRSLERHLSTPLTDQDREIIRGHFEKALRTLPPDHPKRKPRTTNREDERRAANNRAKRVAGI